MIKILHMIGGFILLFSTSVAAAAPLTGINTGASDVDGAEGASLNLRFHACDEDPALTCATIVELVNPAPDAKDTMPDGSLVIGFTMITGLKDKGDGKYRGGKINAVDESISEGEMKWYGLKVNNQFDGTLKAKGCLGPICPRTMIWTAVEETAAN